MTSFLIQCVVDKPICIQYYLIGNSLQIICIESYAEMPIMPTSGVMKKLDLESNQLQYI